MKKKQLKKDIKEKIKSLKIEDLFRLENNLIFCSFFLIQKAGKN